MKTAGTLLIGLAVAMWPLYAQQAQPSVKRHPGEHLNYTVILEEGDVAKVTGVSVHLSSPSSASPTQPGAPSQFGFNCQKSADPRVWSCDGVIPTNIADGDYRLSEVSLGTPDFAKSYDEDFHVPIVPIQNPNTFKPPSKITVTERP
jgi:hypothetical protein